jgi:hypothetical protein
VIANKVPFEQLKMLTGPALMRSCGQYQEEIATPKHGCGITTAVGRAAPVTDVTPVNEDEWARSGAASCQFSIAIPSQAMIDVLNRRMLEPRLTNRSLFFLAARSWKKRRNP